MLPNVTLMPAAEKFIRRIVRLSGLPPGAGLRLAVSPGGCSGYACVFSAEAAPQTGELTLELNGLRLFLGPQSCLTLDGMTMDFSDTVTQSGFSFINPNRESCACSSADAAPRAGITRIGVDAIGRGRPLVPVFST